MPSCPNIGRTGSYISQFMPSCPQLVAQVAIFHRLCLRAHNWFAQVPFISQHYAFVPTLGRTGTNPIINNLLYSSMPSCPQLVAQVAIQLLIDLLFGETNCLFHPHITNLLIYSSMPSCPQLVAQVAIQLV
jgi:hypothetical protein